MLLSEWKFGQEKMYLIPSLSTRRFNGKRNGLRCVFEFSSSFLPNGTFQRLVCLSVAHSASFKNGKKMKEPDLYQDFARIEFEPELSLSLFEDKELQCILVFIEDHTKAFRTFTIVDSMLRKLNADIMSTGLLSWVTLLENPESGHLLRFDHARATQLSPWFDSIRDAESESPDSDHSDSSNTQKNVDLDSFLEAFNHF